MRPALGALGLEPADLRHVVITHSDVDHSGGLGALLEAAPAATAIAHRLDVPWIDDVELLIDRRYRALRPSTSSGIGRATATVLAARGDAVWLTYANDGQGAAAAAAPDARAGLVPSVPLGRFGEPVEVAPTTALLASPESSYTTGSTYDVSGGVRIG